MKKRKQKKSLVKKSLLIILTIMLVIVSLGVIGGGSSVFAESTDDEADSIFSKSIDGIAGLLLYPMKIIPALLAKVLKLIMRAATGEPITIYNILFNKIALTDIDFFSNATGPSADTINEIRNNVAIWYYGIRNLAAVVLAIILVYIGIRMAISTIAEDKAKYKTMFVDWATSLCLLFVLQFIMIATIKINGSLVDALATASSRDGSGDPTNFENLENQLFNGTFSLGFIEGIANSIAYMMVVGMSFVYFLSYMKRMITIAFLIIISPLITVTYSIDKMGDGRSQALNTWLREFVYNILIQPFQCVIYLSLVTTVLKLVTGHTGSINILNVFIAVYVLMFMYKAEEIVKKIFGFRADSMGKTIATAAVTTAVIKRGVEKAKKAKKAAASAAVSIATGAPMGDVGGGSGGSSGPSGPSSTDNLGGSSGSGGSNSSSSSSGSRSSGGSRGSSSSYNSNNTNGTSSARSSNNTNNTNSSNNTNNTNSSNSSNNSGSTTIITNTAKGNSGNTTEGNTVNRAGGNGTNVSVDEAYNTGKEKGKGKRIIKGVASGIARGAGKLLRSEIRGGLKLAGLGFGLSSGDLTAGVLGASLGGAAGDWFDSKIDRVGSKVSEKRQHENHKSQIARDIDDYKYTHGYNDEEIRKKINNWLDGKETPDEYDESANNLYMDLLQEKEMLESKGKSPNKVRSKIDKIVQNTFDGKQSRISPKHVFVRVSGKNNRRKGNKNRYIGVDSDNGGGPNENNPLRNNSDVGGDNDTGGNSTGGGNNNTGKNHTGGRYNNTGENPTEGGDNDTGGKPTGGGSPDNNKYNYNGDSPNGDESPDKSEPISEHFKGDRYSDTEDRYSDTGEKPIGDRYSDIGENSTGGGDNDTEENPAKGGDNDTKDVNRNNARQNRGTSARRYTRRTSYSHERPTARENFNSSRRTVRNRKAPIRTNLNTMRNPDVDRNNNARQNRSTRRNNNRGRGNNTRQS